MKTKSVFSCQTCGYQSAKWLGRCPDCSAWNSFAEETFSQPQSQGESRLIRMALSADAEPVLLKEVKQADDIRVKTGISELDRVLGGGVVKGGVSLLGGGSGDWQIHNCPADFPAVGQGRTEGALHQRRGISPAD